MDPLRGADEPLVWYEGSGTTARNWLIADERGSIVGVANDAGTVTSVNTYDEYGVPASANTGRFGYTGQAWIPEAGVYSYKARVYQPSLGRFNQPDPIGYGSGLNLYGYVGGDPVNLVDPWGLTRDDPTTVEELVVKAAFKTLEVIHQLQEMEQIFKDLTRGDIKPALLKFGGGFAKPLPKCMASFLSRYYPKADVDNVWIVNSYNPLGYTVTIDHAIIAAGSAVYNDPLKYKGHLFHEFTHVRQYESGRLSLVGYANDAMKYRSHDKIPNELRAEKLAGELLSAFNNSPESRQCGN